MTPDPPGQRALIVDDDTQVLRLLERLMTSRGFACVTAGSAADARAKLEQGMPDVALLDLHLPGESGLGLARELSERSPRPAVIMVTGEDDAEVARLALDSGAYGYITKPFTPPEVVIAVQNAVRRRSEETAGRAQRAMLEERVVERTAAAQQALAQLRVAHEETVLRLTRAIEFRDPATGGHTDRMSRYCALLAEEFDLDPDAMRIASRLHDVGKIAVSDAVLRKPGPLTADERTAMQQHAEIGHRILSGSRIELLDQAALIAWAHHERFDGSGYPRGLAGEDIPLVGRIASLADVFDALTTDRVYRAAMTFDEAVATVSAERGRQFDPAVVDAFLAHLDEIRAVAVSFEDDAAGNPPAAVAPDEPVRLLTLQEAAEALGMHPSRLRRWADTGRIAAVRTAGGHRRFTVDAVRHAAGEDPAQRAVVRPVAPPVDRLQPVADRLRADGIELVAMATTSLYRSGPPGWFASDDAAPAVREWLTELVRACESGRYEAALDASEALMRRARLRAATVLERHGFLDRFGEATLRSLSKAGLRNGDLSAARRLMVALQQSHLDRVA